MDTLRVPPKLANSQCRHEQMVDALVGLSMRLETLSLGIAPEIGRLMSMDALMLPDAGHCELIELAA